MAETEVAANKIVAVIVTHQMRAGEAVTQMNLVIVTQIRVQVDT